MIEYIEGALLTLGAIAIFVLWRKLMTPIESANAAIARVSELIGKVNAVGTVLAKSVAAVQDAAAAIIKALEDAGQAVPQDLLDAIAALDAKAQGTLADLEIIEAAPADLDEITTALLNGARVPNPVAK
jgi:hypothetical protein